MVNYKNSCNFAVKSSRRVRKGATRAGIRKYKTYIKTMNSHINETYNEEGKKPHLTAKEEEVMRVLWENGPMLVKEMLEYYPEPRPHVNTVSTVIRVLEKKGYVGHEKEGGSYRYHAILEKDSYRKASLMTILRNYFDNSLKNMVSALVQNEDLSEEEINECIDIIERKKP